MRTITVTNEFEDGEVMIQVCGPGRIPPTVVLSYAEAVMVVGALQAILDEVKAR